MPESEKEKFGVRVGWSNLSSSLQLGKSIAIYRLVKGNLILQENSMVRSPTHRPERS